MRSREVCEEIILPVIDLKGGVVVRGIAGRRDEYRPVQSVLTDDPSPSAIAQAFRNRLGCDDVYVADLDAIAGAAPAWDAYAAIAGSGLQMWLDAGVSDAARAKKLLDRRLGERSIDRIIIGLESLRSPGELANIVTVAGTRRLVFSLDMNEGQPVAASPAWEGRSLLDIAADVTACGIRELIVLDLARVGVRGGTGTEALCRQLKQEWPQVRLIGGGGVNTQEDVRRLSQIGLSRVLVASALHEGRIP